MNYLYTSAAITGSVMMVSRRVVAALQRRMSFEGINALFSIYQSYQWYNVPRTEFNSCLLIFPFLPKLPIFDAMELTRSRNQLHLQVQRMHPSAQASFSLTTR